MFKIFEKGKPPQPNGVRLDGREFDALVGTSADLVRMFNELVEEAKIRVRPHHIEHKDVTWLLDSIQDIGRSALMVYRRMLAESHEQGELRFNSKQRALLVEPDAALLEAPQVIVRRAMTLLDAGATQAGILYDLIIAEVDVVVKRWTASASIDLINKLKAGT
jgi:hypothetical protein